MKHLDALGRPQSEASGVAQILHECALHRSPAVLLNLESKEVAAAEFEAFWEDGIVFDIFPNRPDLFPTGSLCSVAFDYGDRSHVFLASVIGSRETSGPEPIQLRLETPWQIAAGRGRIRYRVPVSKDCGLRVSVSAQDRQLPGGRALNLSLTGTLIEFAEGAFPRLPIGVGLKVRLEFGEIKISLAGEVVHAQGRQYGVSFPEARKAGVYDPPEALRKIVRTLERSWLRERVSVADRGSGA